MKSASKLLLAMGVGLLLLFSISPNVSGFAQQSPSSSPQQNQNSPAQQDQTGSTQQGDSSGQQTQSTSAAQGASASSGQPGALLSVATAESHVGNLTGHAGKGKQLYQRYCVGCHGVRGDSQGENAPWVDPKPRDFTAGLFKCRSTPSGSIPLDSDLFDTIGRGVDTTAMPSWFPLTNQERAELVAYVKTFSPRFKEEKPEAPVPIPSETPNTPESIHRGHELFQNMKCWECHGNEGRGNGPSAATLRDNKGNPIPPYDFTTGTRFKCGVTNHDLYRIFMTGLDGTPMPSFIDYLQPDQAWDLVHYLRTLQVHYKEPGKSKVVAAGSTNK